MADKLTLRTYKNLETQVDALKTDGYVYFPNMLEKEQVAQLRDTMDLLEPRDDSFDQHITPGNGGYLNKIINNTFNRDTLFLTFLDKSKIIEVAEEIHGPECHVIGMTAWITGPGRPNQNLHVDWLPISLPEDIAADPRVNMPIFITTTHFYLNNLFENLGPTQFVPGSHKSGRGPNGDVQWNGIEPQSILCNAGDAVMFRSEVWHRGTKNTSNKIRYLLQVHYANRMITQKFPPYLNRFQFNEGILSQATPRQRRLLGEHRRSNYD